MRTGPIRRTDWLPVGDTAEGEQLDRSYDSQSEGSSAEEEAMRADPAYDEWDDYFSQAILKKIGERTGVKPNYVDSDDGDEEDNSDDEDEGLLESYARGRDSLPKDPSTEESLSLLLGQ